MKTPWFFACALIATTCGTVAVAQDAVGGGGRGPAIIRPTPVPPPGWVYRWIGPVYQTVADRIWIADRVEMISEWVTINGRLEQVWRQVVIPGHWETTTRRVLISDGHYELVRIDPPPVIISPPIFINPPVVVMNPGTVGVEGYKTVQTEDLSKFSPLKEWPDKK